MRLSYLPQRQGQVELNVISKFRDIAFLRFLVVGVGNTLFSVGIYWFLIYLGLNYSLALALCQVCSVVFSFSTHRAVVFKVRGRFVRYALVWLIIYFLNVAMVGICRKFTGDYWAVVMLLPVNIVLSFLLMKHLVFRVDEPPH